jgi:hypothetical protein
MSDVGADDSDTLQAESSNASQQFFGKYRATVINNVDPMQLGRIQVIVPDVSTFVPSSWAMPCLPVGGIQMGMFTVPLLGAGVWIEFEQGDPDYPIWVGCYWGSAVEVPAMAHAAPPGVPSITMQTPLNTCVQISDLPGPTGGIILKTVTASLIINETGIYIQNGKGAMLTMIGNIVTINQGALTVM